MCLCVVGLVVRYALHAAAATVGTNVTNEQKRDSLVSGGR